MAMRALRKPLLIEPVTWEPPFDWVTGVSWPGPHPDDISAADLHPLIRAPTTHRDDEDSAQMLNCPRLLRLSAGQLHLTSGFRQELPEAGRSGLACDAW